MFVKIRKDMIYIYIYKICYRFRIFKIFFQDNIQSQRSSLRNLQIDNTTINNSTINNRLIRCTKIILFIYDLNTIYHRIYNDDRL